jgi:predicted nucleotide-binding protein
MSRQQWEPFSMKPSLFVASSVEGLPIAHAVHDNLQRDAEVTVWEHGVFGLSEYPVESLLRQIDQSDFGAFAFTLDDMLTMREQTHSVVRDNVIFELGFKFWKTTAWWIALSPIHIRRNIVSPRS